MVEVVSGGGNGHDQFNVGWSEILWRVWALWTSGGLGGNGRLEEVAVNEGVV